MPTPNLTSGDPFAVVSSTKLRRVSFIALALRFAAFCFATSAAVFMGTSGKWREKDPFRVVFAANAIVAAYSLVEVGMVGWEVVKGATVLPDGVQLWFDFGHDQLFAYMLISAEAAATREAVVTREMDKGICSTNNVFCLQSDISIALGFVGFCFLALSAFMSAFRVTFFLVRGSRSLL